MEEMYLRELIYLSKKIGVNKSKVVSTTEIAKDLDFSQQTASRRLMELEEKKLVKKELTVNGQKIELTKKAIEVLERNYLHLKNIFTKKKSKLTGIISSGIGEGKYYVQIKKYQDEFEKLLGKKPFAGTLNVAVNVADYKDFIMNKEKISIDGFTTGARTFGRIDCFKIKINNVEGAIIIPERTTHPENIMEVIAPVYLRGKFKLKDNDKVDII